MLTEILNIVAPVFIVIGAGYLAVRVGLLSAGSIDHLMKFAITFAIPCLLFRATSSIDLVAAFDWRILLAYYAAAIGCFFAAFLIVKTFFKRRPGEAVGVAFAALFSNLVFLGLPISERAWGADSLAPNFALVSVNAPICYLIGITTMELLRADGRGAVETTRIVVNAIFRNSLMIGIGLGFIVNISGFALPEALIGAVDLLAHASLPVGLFALGGVLIRYSLSKSLGEASLISLLSLIVQPAITLLLGHLLQLPESLLRSVVLMAAVAPGLNAYLFASMYNRGIDAAASTVLLSTLLSVFSVSAWLIFL
ncbi:MAG: AEC family transporter [Gammaproteobacteria bacterium]|nr:AEC family transporter [Gammaproteobacteria bacterium]MDH3535490.1 AEC family transporter [Gammaproteobacteria bacterium]